MKLRKLRRPAYRITAILENFADKLGYLTNFEMLFSAVLDRFSLNSQIYQKIEKTFKGLFWGRGGGGGGVIVKNSSPTVGCRGDSHLKEVD